MRLFILFLALLFTNATGQQGGCSSGDFKLTAMKENDPTERKIVTLKWIKKEGSKCNKEQLAAIWSSLGWVMGSADNLEIRSTIEGLYQRLN